MTTETALSLYRGWSVHLASGWEPGPEDRDYCRMLVEAMETLEENGLLNLFSCPTCGDEGDVYHEHDANPLSEEWPLCSKCGTKMRTQGDQDEEVAAIVEVLTKLIEEDDDNDT